MKVYKTQKGIVVEKDGLFYVLENQNWDTFINDDEIFSKLNQIIEKNEDSARGAEMLEGILKPVQSQEIWASGVTYFRSKVGRQEESKGAGGGEFYARVYEADRPELFFKSTAQRAVGHEEYVKIRKDSTWDVPEPELTLVVTSSGKIIGYTIGNDMSSRSIEGENPLYLPQAKTYDASAAIGPCIYITGKPLPEDTLIEMKIFRKNEAVFEGNVELKQMKRKPEELVSYLFRECSFPQGCLLMTGTGIVPSSDFTLQKNDVIHISIEPIGTLINTVN